MKLLKKLTSLAILLVILLSMTTLVYAMEDGSTGKPVVHVYHVFEELPESWEYAGFSSVPDGVNDEQYKNYEDADVKYYTDEDGTFEYYEYANGTLQYNSFASNNYGDLYNAYIKEPDGNYKFTDGATGDTFSYNAQTQEYTVNTSAVEYTYNENKEFYLTTNNHVLENYKNVKDVKEFMNNEFSIKEAYIQYETSAVDITQQEKNNYSNNATYKTLYMIAGSYFDTQEYADGESGLSIFDILVLDTSKYPSSGYIKHTSDEVIYNYITGVAFPLATAKNPITYTTSDEAPKYLDGGKTKAITLTGPNYAFTFEDNFHYDLTIIYGEGGGNNSTGGGDNNTTKPTVKDPVKEESPSSTPQPDPEPEAEPFSEPATDGYGAIIFPLSLLFILLALIVGSALYMRHRRRNLQ